MKIHVIGDSITYLVKKHGGVQMFAERGHEAILDGDPGDRADTPARLDAWVAALRAPEPPQLAVYALAANDLMKETFSDPAEPTWSSVENAYLLSALHRALAFGAGLVEHVAWVNVTERTMNGNYNRGARMVNAAMYEACAANGWGYVDWNVRRAPTTDLIHPKPEGSAMWVDAVADLIDTYSIAP